MLSPLVLDRPDDPRRSVAVSTEKSVRLTKTNRTVLATPHDEPNLVEPSTDPGLHLLASVSGA